MKKYKIIGITLTAIITIMMIDALMRRETVLAIVQMPYEVDFFAERQSDSHGVWMDYVDEAWDKGPEASNTVPLTPVRLIGVKLTTTENQIAQLLRSAIVNTKYIKESSLRAHRTNLVGLMYKDRDSGLLCAREGTYLGGLFGYLWRVKISERYILVPIDYETIPVNISDDYRILFPYGYDYYFMESDYTVERNEFLRMVPELGGSTAVQLIDAGVDFGR